MPNCDCPTDSLRQMPKAWNQEISDSKSLDSFVSDAIGRTLAEKKLVGCNVGERVISHRLALHLQALLMGSGWQVDCEYNRHLEIEKSCSRTQLEKKLNELAAPTLAADKLLNSLLLNQNNLIESANKAIEALDLETKQETPRRIFPDLVVHKRGCDHYNVLVIEMKANKTTDPAVLLDWAKLSAMTSEATGCPKYRFGLFLDFSNSSKVPGVLFDGHNKLSAISFSPGESGSEGKTR